MRGIAGNSENKYHKTGKKKPNAWGLYDMLGNVAEWTLDQYSDQYFTTVADKDPFTEPTSRYPKTLKGGGFNTSAGMMRSAARFKSECKLEQTRSADSKKQMVAYRRSSNWI